MTSTADARKLTEFEYLATMCPPLQDVTEAATDVLDIWPYVGSVTAADLEGHLIYEDFVEAVYRSSDGGFEHVLVMTKTRNTYLVVVIDLVRNAVLGHHLLDLNEKYGIS